MLNPLGMQENELSKPGKVGAVLIFVIPVIASALFHIWRGEAPSPASFVVIIIGFILFLVAKLSVIRNKKLISLGTGLMTQNMADLYRIGYWVMVVGILLTFA